MEQITPVRLVDDNSDQQSMEEIRKEMKNYSAMKEDSFDFEEDTKMKEIFETNSGKGNKKQIEKKKVEPRETQPTTANNSKKVESKEGKREVVASPFGMNSLALGTLSIGDDLGEENNEMKKTVIMLLNKFEEQIKLGQKKLEKQAKQKSGKPALKDKSSERLKNRKKSEVFASKNKGSTMTFGKESKRSEVRANDSELMGSKAIKSLSNNESPQILDSRTNPASVQSESQVPLPIHKQSTEAAQAPMKKPYINQSNDLFRLLLEQAPKPKDPSSAPHHDQTAEAGHKHSHHPTHHRHRHHHEFHAHPKRHTPTNREHSRSKSTKKPTDQDRSKSKLKAEQRTEDRSASIPKPKNRSKTPVHSDFHERLFYRGIETLKKKEEKAELDFSIRYPFKPNVQPSINLTRISDSKINQLTYEYKTRDTIREKKRLLNENVDPKDGLPLYSPRITRQSPVRHKQTLDQIEAEESKRRSFVANLKQIFDFLDKGYEGVIYASKIDYENLHPELARLLNRVIFLVIKADLPLSFAQFYHLVVDNGLSNHVQDIFYRIDQEPYINPKKLKASPFKFN
jgi:hypothetical protein